MANMAITVTVSSQKPPAPHGYISISRKKLLQNLEISAGARLNGWVDSMRASSPTHIKSTPSLANNQGSWNLHHPYALEMFEQIIDASKGKQIMFLDYDGTLSPIIEDPDRAFTYKKIAMSSRRATRDCMCHARPTHAGHPTEAIRSRSFDRGHPRASEAIRGHPNELCEGIRGQPSELCERIRGKPSEGRSPGVHGDLQGRPEGMATYKVARRAWRPMCWDVHVPCNTFILSNSQPVLYQPASEFLPMINELYKQLVDTTKSTPGAKVENKFCVSVHFQNGVNWHSRFRSVLKEYPKLRLTQGRKVLEIRPTI
ncbi:putative DNA binding protein [Hibiscus syriacus]|uniref:trehalose-phosphatase n=1 Tax=Hibiscus syriacus TaxID=106335 RepID=A0A6A2XL95_HIBSY|nr:putative DNA binding protein [Hibiscus syriacus]